jgi:hypothetical protein
VTTLLNNVLILLYTVRKLHHGVAWAWLEPGAVFFPTDTIGYKIWDLDTCTTCAWVSVLILICNAVFATNNKQLTKFLFLLLVHLVHVINGELYNIIYRRSISCSFFFSFFFFFDILLLLYWCLLYELVTNQRSTKHVPFAYPNHQNLEHNRTDFREHALRRKIIKCQFTNI